MRFITSFSLVSGDPEADDQLFRGALELPLHPPKMIPDSDYLYTEQLEGARHFGVWPLREAALACFGTDAWPDSHPVPQASVEFEVDDVDAAARELEEKGYRLVHPPRTEPWGQVIARVQSADGVLVGVCDTRSLG